MKSLIEIISKKIRTSRIDVQKEMDNGNYTKVYMILSENGNKINNKDELIKEMYQRIHSYSANPKSVDDTLKIELTNLAEEIFRNEIDKNRVEYERFLVRMAIDCYRIVGEEVGKMGIASIIFSLNKKLKYSALETRLLNEKNHSGAYASNATYHRIIEDREYALEQLGKIVLK